jgi:hypothetical protein
MNLFKARKESEPDNNKNKNKGDDGPSNYKDAFKTGSSIAGIITSKWNSQEKPGKVYVANRRIHHGGIGSVMKLSKYFKKSEPTVTGIVSGIGEGLAKDDYADKKEWFKFRKKEDESPSTTETLSTPTNSNSISPESQETSNTSRSEDNNDRENSK